MPTYTTQQIAERVQGRLEGPGDLAISAIDDIASAAASALTFIRDDKYARQWPASKATAALVGKGVSVSTAPAGERRALIHVADADLALAVALEMFALPTPRPPVGVHPTAIIDPAARLGRGVAIGPCCVVGARATLGDGCVLHNHVTLFADVTLGSSCELFTGVVVRERVHIGARCTLHPAVVIGKDGFGYRSAPDGRGLVKIPQIGTVHIGDDVEVGAATTIDRAKFAATVIGDGTKIDNQCQIAHNCTIGRCCVIAGQTGLAGSVTVGDGVVIGGGVIVRDHVTIGAGAKIAGGSGVMGDVPPGQTWAGYPAQEHRAALREGAAVRRLPDFLKSMKGEGRSAKGEKS